MTILTFAPMNGHSLHPLEQEVFMNGIHICFLLSKDEHLPKKVNSSQRASYRIPHHYLVLRSLGPASPAVLTGGGVFCKHSSRYTILASSFTYSTSCHHRGQVR